MCTVEVAISCLNDDLYKAIGFLDNIAVKNKVSIHIIHQKNIDKDYSSYYRKIDADARARYSILDELGLPASRNHALESCRADFLLPTDSDVILTEGFYDFVVKAFNNLPDADFITFQSYYDEKLTKPRRNFSSERFIHNWRTLLSVSSIEIVIKINRFKDKGVKWDPDFGLGAKWGGGLETVMLQTARSKSLRGYYEPKPLASHSEESSGAIVSIERVQLRTAVFLRCFGVLLGYFFSLYYHLLSDRRFISIFGLRRVLYNIFSIRIKDITEVQ